MYFYAQVRIHIEVYYKQYANVRSTHIEWTCQIMNI